MKLSVSNIAWDPRKNPIALSILRNYGIKYIDIAPTLIFDNLDNIDMDKIKIFKDYGFEFSGMQSLLFPYPNISLFDGNYERSILLNYFEKVCKLAKVLEIKNLVFGSPKNRLIRKDVSIDLDSNISIFREISDSAKNYDCTICLEPNPVEYGCNFITNTTQAAEFIKLVDKDNFKLNLDISTSLLCNENLEYLFKSNSDIIEHIHISSPFISEILNIDNEKNFEIIRNYNYEGFIVMECLFKDDPGLEKFHKNIDCFVKYYNKI